ncbi:MAG: DUF305 domain-containing protein [Bacteroidetes bacterium]|nr:DUF305 domain-containing protein [Bacteroidota bacterium]
MKHLIKISLCIVLTAAIISCKKDKDITTLANSTTPSHESNRMMMEMHKMMNKMDTMDMSGGPDNHFAKMMRMHHMGAIDMSNIVLAEGSDTTIRRIAQMMVQKQNMEIIALTNFLNNHAAHPDSMDFNMKMKLSMEKMHRNADLQKVNGNIDHDFAILMIFHHQSAIEMADLVIHYGHEMTIRNMAEMMKDDQEMEIEELQKWLLR